MKLIVVGASGLVGGNLLKTALATGHEAIGTYAAHAVAGLQPLRLEEENTVRELLEGFRPDAVVCCAGWSWVDGCEGDPERAVRENALQPSRLGGLALSVGARFLSFSTSYVFDGRAGPYDEAAATRPLSVYGETKLRGEELILKATEGQGLIARTMGVYGEEAQKKNFVYQVVRNLRAGQTMTVPSDQRGNASHAEDLAAMSLSLLDQRASGIWNLAGPEPDLYRKDFALRIAKEYGLDAGLFRFCSTEELGQPARRPLGGGLIIEKGVAATGIQPSSWKRVPIPVE